MRLLLVEDDEMIAETVLESMGREGYAIDWAQDGRAAELSLGNGVYDLVLLDLNLPGISGHSVLAEIKQDPTLLTIPVVVLTSSESEADIVKSYEEHANCFISKPVDFSSFLDIVSRIENFWFSIVRLPQPA